MSVRVSSSRSDGTGPPRWLSGPILLAVATVLLITGITGASLGRARLEVAPAIDVGAGARSVPALGVPPLEPTPSATTVPARAAIATVPVPTTDVPADSAPSVSNWSVPTPSVPTPPVSTPSVPSPPAAGPQITAFRAATGAGVVGTSSSPTTSATGGGEAGDSQPSSVTAVEPSYPIITTHDGTEWTPMATTES